MITKEQERRLDQLCGIQKEYAKLYEEDLLNEDGTGFCAIGTGYVQLSSEKFQQLFGEQVRTERIYPGEGEILSAMYHGVKFVAYVPLKEGADDAV